MSGARRQLRNAKKLVRLRLVQQSQASVQVAEARELFQRSAEALAAAEAAIVDEDDQFRSHSPKWGSITNFEAALQQRTARRHDATSIAANVEACQEAQGRAVADLRAHDARLSAAERLVLIHRQQLRQTLDRLEQAITDDLSVLKKSRDS